MGGAVVDYARINTAYQVGAARNRQADAPLDARPAGFDEVQQPLSATEAQREASRCFSCGSCINCESYAQKLVTL